MQKGKLHKTQTSAAVLVRAKKVRVKLNVDPGTATSGLYVNFIFVCSPHCASLITKHRPSFLYRLGWVVLFHCQISQAVPIML